MDYGRMICEMLAHTHDSRNTQNIVELLQGLVFAICEVSALYTKSAVDQENLLDHLFALIYVRAKERFVEEHGDQDTEISAEDFLKNLFNPVKFDG